MLRPGLVVFGLCGYSSVYFGGSSLSTYLSGTVRSVSLCSILPVFDAAFEQENGNMEPSCSAVVNDRYGAALLFRVV